MLRFPKPIRRVLTKLFANEKQPYLKEIGVTSWPGNHFDGIYNFKSIRSALRCKRIKRKTGVDPRDCWDLDNVFYLWLYTHLKQLLKDTNCDLEWRKYKHNEKTYTEGEYIEYLIDLCKQAILFDEFKDCPEIDWEIINNPEEKRQRTIKFLNEEKELEKFREQELKNYEELEALEKEIFDVFYELRHDLWW